MAFNLKLNKQMQTNGALFMFIAVIMFVSIVGWYAQRWITYDRAEAAICEMVKPEALVDPSVCEK